MGESKELEKIKEKYGEGFMNLCKELFPTLLETEGKLYDTLESLFVGADENLYEDIIRGKKLFGDYVNGKNRSRRSTIVLDIISLCDS